MNIIVSGVVEIELTDPEEVCGISTEPGPAQHFPLGTRVITPDGKQWTYNKFGPPPAVDPLNSSLKYVKNEHYRK